jgi:tRNA pseudouridine32 synthase/23S rRNA pseudouridine746 synthase/23S rRNA pseudouridine955/2504/2580 synthase
VSGELPLLYRAEGYLAVDKPAGMLVIPGRTAQEGSSLREQLRAQLGQDVLVVHRLDRDTSGVMLFALEAGAHRTLSMAFEAGAIQKRYLALVAGRLAAPLELTASLLPARRSRMRVARPGEAGKSAHTKVRPLELFQKASLVEAEPLTGRQHQIRVHLTAAGHPLLVDRQYGSPPVEGRPDLGLFRTPLLAWRLSIPALEGIAPKELEAPLPADMRQALERLR